MILGAIIGGVLGHQIGGGHGRDLATVAGAVAGGAIGNNVDNNGTRRLSGFDMTIRLDNGQTLRTTQPADQVFTSGTRVRVESNGNSTKVIKLNY